MPKDFQFTLSVFELPGFTPWRQTVWLSGVSFMHFFSFLKVYLQIRYPVGMKIIWYSPDKKGSKLQPCHFATWSVVLVINHVSPSLVFLKDDILKRKREKKKAFKRPILVMHETAPQELDRWEEELTPLSCFCADISNQYNSAVVTW